MPSLAEFRAWMKVQETSLSDDLLQTLVDGEQSSQAKACNVPEGDLPADLVEALYMRVARAAARRGVPLGVMTGFGDAGTGFARPTTFDPDIKRLESGYPRYVVG